MQVVLVMSLWAASIDDQIIDHVGYSGSMP